MALDPKTFDPVAFLDAVEPDESTPQVKTTAAITPESFNAEAFLSEPMSPEEAANNPGFDVAEATAAGDVDLAMAVDQIRKLQDKRGKLDKTIDAIKGIPGIVSDFVGGIGDAAGNLVTAGVESAKVGAEMERVYRGAIKEGKTPDEARELASQVSSLAGDVAKQQALAQAQLGATQGLDFLGKAGNFVKNAVTEFGPVGAARDAYQLATGDGSVEDRLSAISQRKIDAVTGNDLTDEEKRDAFIREQMMELQRRELEQGKVAGLEGLAMPEEEVDQNQGVFDSGNISRGSNIYDPTNYVPFGVTGKAGAKVAGGALKGLGIVTEFVSSAPMKGAKALLNNKWGKIATGAGGVGAAGAAGAALYNDPTGTLGKAAATLAGTAGLAALGATGGRFGRLLREAGSEAINPNFVSQSGRAAADALVRTADDSNRLLREIVSPAHNYAVADRAARRALTGATQGSLESGALAALYSDDYEQWVNEVAAGIGLGGLFGTVMGTVDGAGGEAVRRDYGNMLAEQGRDIRFNTGFDEASAAAMSKLSQEDQHSVNKVRGWMSKMRSEDGTPIQVYPLEKQAFADAVEADGTPREQADRGQAYTSKDGTKIFINVDALGKSVDASGHEIFHSAQQALNSQIAPQIMDSLAYEIRTNLYDADGNPKPVFREFIKNRFSDESGRVPEGAEGEFLAEVSMNLMGGANIERFALPPSMRQMIRRGASQFQQKYLGAEHPKGTTFRGQEIALNFDAVNDVLFDIGRIARQTDQATGAKFRIEQIDNALSQPLPENATPEQKSERAKLEKERDNLLDEQIKNEEYPEYNPPKGERSAKKDAYIESVQEDFKRTKEQRERLEAEFDEYADYLEENGIPFPDDADIRYSVVNFLTGARESTIASGQPSRRKQGEARSPDSLPMPEAQDAPADLDGGAYIDPENPNRIIRPRPVQESTSVSDAESVSPEIPTVEPDAVAPQQEVNQQPQQATDRRLGQSGEGIINEYVELGDTLSEPLPPDATPEQIAERQRATRRRAAIGKQLRNDFGIDPSQLDDVFPGETVSEQSPSPDQAPTTADVPPPMIDQPDGPDAATIPEPESVETQHDAEPTAIPEPESAEPQSVVTLPEAVEGGQAPVTPIPDLPIEVTPADRADTRRIPVIQTPEQIASIEAGVTREIGSEYRAGRKGPERVNHDIAKLRRDKLAQRHSESIPNVEASDSVTWREDPLTGRKSISGRRFVEGDWFNDLILRESGLTPDQVQNLRAIQDAADSGRAIWLVYDSAERTGGTRAADQAKSTAAQRASGEGASELKKDLLFLTGFTVNNPASPSPQAGKITANGLSYDRLAGNARKIAEKLGKDSPYSINEDGTISDAFLKDFQKYTANHRNGWKGDGSAPMKSIEGVNVEPTPDYIGDILGRSKEDSKRRADFINLAMNDASAAGRSARAALRRDLATQNEGFLSADGETNALRQKLSEDGKLPDLDRVSTNHAVDLIYDVGDNAKDADAAPLRSEQAEIEGFETVRTPRNDFVSAGFRPDNLGMPELQKPQSAPYIPLPRSIEEDDEE